MLSWSETESEGHTLLMSSSSVSSLEALSYRTISRVKGAKGGNYGFDNTYSPTRKRRMNETGVWQQVHGRDLARHESYTAGYVRTL